jgi:enoyl-CoA hydratase/carnithine racemase
MGTRDLPTVILHQLDTPVICAINGPAAGYGLDLALGCDLRLMAAGATLIPGFAKRAIVPESGGTWYLPRLVGWAKACEIGFLGEDLAAPRALELGLVNRVVPDDALRAEALAWAQTIAANAPLAIKAMKRLYRHGLSEDFESHSHHVLMQLMQLFRSQDFQEGIAAFVERRVPRFEGR